MEQDDEEEDVANEREPYADHYDHADHIENKLLNQAQKSAKWMVCHWIRNVLWEVACQGLQRCHNVLLQQQPSSTTIATESPAPLIQVTAHHLEKCENLCRQVATAWSGQLRQDPTQPMAVVAEWIDQVAEFGRFWDVDHSRVILEMMLLRDSDNSMTTSDEIAATSTTTMTMETNIDPTDDGTHVAPANDNNCTQHKTTSSSVLKKTYLPVTRLLRLGKRPAPKSARGDQPQDPDNNRGDDDDVDDHAQTLDDVDSEDDTEDPVQRTKRLLQAIQNEFQSASASGSGFYYWPAKGKNLDLLQQVADEIPQRLHFDKLEEDDDEEVVEAIPKSVWEQRRLREHQRQQLEQEDGEAPNGEPHGNDEAKTSNDDGTGSLDATHSHESTPDEQAKIVSRWIEKRKRSRAAALRRIEPSDHDQQQIQFTNGEDTLALRPNKRYRREVEEETPRQANRMGHVKWSMEQIKDSFSRRQQEKLYADMIHLQQQVNGETSGSNNSYNKSTPLVVLGALKTVGHVHCALQYAHDKTQPAPLPDMDGWSSKQCRRWFRKAVQERLGTHRYLGKDEHGFSYQTFTKVLRTIERARSTSAAVAEGGVDDRYWLDLDLGECLLEVPAHGGGDGRRQTLCAFSSLEVTLLDEDDDENGGDDDDERDFALNSQRFN